MVTAAPHNSTAAMHTLTVSYVPLKRKLVTDLGLRCRQLRCMGRGPYGESAGSGKFFWAHALSCRR
jgi:hypothetical protein